MYQLLRLEKSDVWSVWYVSVRLSSLLTPSSLSGPIYCQVYSVSSGLPMLLLVHVKGVYTGRKAILLLYDCMDLSTPKNNV